MAGFAKKVMGVARELYEAVLISHRRRCEVKKFQDARRVKIYSTVQLSDSQKSAIDKLFLKNYGEKIPYTWHRHFTAYTGKFDVNYFPELLFIPEFEYFMNPYQEYVQVFADKNVLPMVAEAAGVRMPKTFLSCVRGQYRNVKGQAITKKAAVSLLGDIGEAFMKPTVDSSSGEGCMLVDFHDGADLRSGRSAAEVLEMMGLDFVVQQRCVCHESIRKLYPDSLNTFRVITYRWNEEIIAMPVIMRIGRGGNYLDNAHAGGMFIAVGNDGKLHKSAFTEFRDEFTQHPDTNVVFDGYQIENFAHIVQAALRMHETVPQIGVVNWDFTLDETGEPLLIEANTKGGSIWLIEMAHGCGGFGDRTAEVLRWLSKIKHTKKSQREKLYFGKMESNR